MKFQTRITCEECGVVFEILEPEFWEKEAHCPYCPDPKLGKKNSRIEYVTRQWNETLDEMSTIAKRLKQVEHRLKVRNEQYQEFEERIIEEITTQLTLRKQLASVRAVRTRYRNQIIALKRRIKYG